MKIINLSLTLEQVQMIANALGDQPFKAVEELINTIRAQATPQINPPQVPAEALPQAEKTEETPSQE